MRLGTEEMFKMLRESLFDSAKSTTFKIVKLCKREVHSTCAFVENNGEVLSVVWFGKQLDRVCFFSRGQGKGFWCCRHQQLFIGRCEYFPLCSGRQF